MTFDRMPEHEFEAELGLPQSLPRGERLLWRGAPDWRVLARDAMHVRALAIYFGVLLAWRGASVWSDGGTLPSVALAVLWLLVPALLALGMLTLLAWLVSRTSAYTVTDKRVVMRIGIVLSITFNLPYTKIDAARLHARADGSGDLCLLLDGDDRIAYVHLWPHARAWHLKRTEPMLRAVPDVRYVAALLSAALAEAAGLARTPSLISPLAPRAPLAPLAPLAPTALLAPVAQLAPTAPLAVAPAAGHAPQRIGLRLAA